MNNLKCGDIVEMDNRLGLVVEVATDSYILVHWANGSTHWHSKHVLTKIATNKISKKVDNNKTFESFCVNGSEDGV